MTGLEKYIDTEIVVSSGDALRYCEETLGITNMAARKKLQRLPSHIYKIKGICRDGQSILYYEKNKNAPDFFEKLVKVLKNNSLQHYAVLNALTLLCGIAAKDILAEYTVSPTGNMKGHKKFGTIIQDLKFLRMIAETDDYYMSSCDGIPRNEKRSKAIHLIHRITIEHFYQWARNIGLFSYESAKFHAELSLYQFAIVAPSYINSLVTLSKNGTTIPAFVVADIMLNRDISKEDVEFFIKKLENVSMRNPNAKIIPFLLLGTHSQEVYHALKSKGIIIGNIDELFGDKYTESVYGILNLIENAGAILKKNPDQYLKIIDSIEKLSTGKTYNLKGDLFEMAVGYYHGQMCRTLEVSKEIYFDTKKREIDVCAVYTDKVVFAECKGYNSMIKVEFIEKWLSDKIPVIRNWALSCESLCDKQIVFEIWSTGGFTEDAEKLLSEARQRTKKYQIEFYDYRAMIQIAKDKKIRHFIKILDSYYVKEI